MILYCTLVVAALTCCAVYASKSIGECDRNTSLDVRCEWENWARSSNTTNNSVICCLYGDADNLRANSRQIIESWKNKIDFYEGENFEATEMFAWINSPVTRDVGFTITSAEGPRILYYDNDYVPKDADSNLQIHVTFDENYLRAMGGPVVAVIGILNHSRPASLPEYINETARADNSNLYLKLELRINNQEVSEEGIKAKFTYRNFLTDFSENVSIVAKEIMESVEPECIRFTNTTGWTNEGCSGEGNIKHWSCSCNSGTIFGVRVVYLLQPVPEVLSVLGIILVSISCVLLLVTSCCLIVHRKSLTKSKRNFIQIGIASSFCGAGISSLAHFIDYKVTGPNSFCEAVTILEAYFSISTSLWLLNDGILLVIKLRFAGYISYENLLSSSRIVVISLWSWLFPLSLVVGISIFEIETESLIPMMQLYKFIRSYNEGQLQQTGVNETAKQVPIEPLPKYLVCVSRRQSATFVVSVSFMVLAFCFNLFVCGYVSFIMWQKNFKSGEKNPSKIGNTLFALVCLSWSLGLPQFATAFLMRFSNNVIGRFIVPNCLVSLQGPFVFYFYFWRNQVLIRSIKTRCMCKKY